MGYTVSEVAKALKAKLYPPKGYEDSAIDKLLIDSRSLIEPEGTLFVALKTSKNDGHFYIHELYQKGIRLFLVEESFKDSNLYKDAVFCRVKDTLKAMQQLAAWH